MKLFDFLNPRKSVQGTIGYYRLTDWWLTAFDDSERSYIKGIFQPLGSSSDSLTSGNISYSSQSVVSFLSGFAGWFYKAQDRTIARKILDHAAEITSDASVLDVHFLCQQTIQTYYKDRDNPSFMAKAIDACRKQISLASQAAKEFETEYPDSPLPSHKGYEQLAIVLEKQGDLQEAITLCQQAESEGWCGDWSHRIERCKKKLAKA